MARELSGGAALVTGGARRIGRAIALALGRAGVDVVVHYRSSRAEAEQVVRELEDLGVGAGAARADLRLEGELAGLVEDTTRLVGPLSLLVNSASSFPETTFESVGRADLLAGVELEAWAPFELARRFAPTMRDGAHVVNLLDTRIAAQYDWRHFAYCAAKHLLGLFTELMAIRLAPRIAVHGVAPGLILPPPGKDRAYLEARKDELPLRRVGAPADVADAVLYLARTEFVTGQTLFVDGGRHLLGGSFG